MKIKTGRSNYVYRYINSTIQHAFNEGEPGTIAVADAVAGRAEAIMSAAKVARIAKLEDRLEHNGSITRNVSALNASTDRLVKALNPILALATATEGAAPGDADEANTDGRSRRAQ